MLSQTARCQPRSSYTPAVPQSQVRFSRTKGIHPTPLSTETNLIVGYLCQICELITSITDVAQLSDAFTFAFAKFAANPSRGSC